MQIDVGHTTNLLRRFAAGDSQAQEPLYTAVCAELRRVAGGLMKETPPGHTLQPTALVHEAWIRLIGQAERTFVNRQHFLCVASKAMRSVLVDHVRAKRAMKRGGEHVRVDLDEAVAYLEAGETDLLDLEQALTELEQDDPELARVVELHFFGGLSQSEVSEVLGVSLSTVERSWRIARARLHRRMAGEAGPS
ncbi:MAG: sigma-70 family RNA polymerase sigma factor [Planctomycetes bacterium]|nr:sigma-70 family RNA polymerase sigma factor [Planctomycetota bacterium]